MMDGESMLTIFGGMGLFLLGMSMLTNGLKDIAGETLKRWLNKFTRGTGSSIVTGAVLTVLMQSSTATTLLTIGFVSAGLLTFLQSIGVIIGANIGSTSTGWIISLIGFKISLQTMSLPIIGVGVFITYIAPNNMKKFGSALAGFGLLFLAIDMLQQGMGNTQDLIAFNRIPADSIGSALLLILIGLAMTVIMQASSAAMAATLAALFTGAIDFEQAAYLVIGQNIGTTATALFAVLGASIPAKRTAMMHFLFNTMTAVVVTLGFTSVMKLTKWITVLISGYFNQTIGLAIFHTMFSIIGMLLIVPFIKPFAQFIIKIIPERENTLTKNLDDGLLRSSSVAMEISFNTLRDIMSHLTKVTITLITQKKVTAEYEKSMLEVEEAVDITREYINKIQSNSNKERHRHLSILHTLDHLGRLIKVLREQQKVEAIYLQEELMRQWQSVLEQMMDSLHDDEQLGTISFLLEETSQKMAKERREKRNEYFERSVQNETEWEEAMSKVEALLWIDRLIFHYWRATARLAEFQEIAIGETKKKL